MVLYVFIFTYYILTKYILHGCIFRNCHDQKCGYYKLEIPHWNCCHHMPYFEAWKHISNGVCTRHLLEKKEHIHIQQNLTIFALLYCCICIFTLSVCFANAYVHKHIYFATVPDPLVYLLCPWAAAYVDFLLQCSFVHFISVHFYAFFLLILFRLVWWPAWLKYMLLFSLSIIWSA